MSSSHELAVERLRLEDPRDPDRIGEACLTRVYQGKQNIHDAAAKMFESMRPQANVAPEVIATPPDLSPEILASLSDKDRQTYLAAKAWETSGGADKAAAARVQEAMGQSAQQAIDSEIQFNDAQIPGQETTEQATPAPEVSLEDQRYNDNMAAVEDAINRRQAA